MTPDRSQRLDSWLAKRGCRALLVWGDTSTDPWLSPFVGPARIGPCFVVVPRGGPARLGYLSPMERDEAEASDLPRLTPEALDVQRWSRDAASMTEILAGTFAHCLALCQLAPGRLAVAGRLSAGHVLTICRQLETEGWSCLAGEEAIEAVRRQKTAGELDEIRRVASIVGKAFRLVAGRLAEVPVAAQGTLLSSNRPLTVGALRRLVARCFADHGLTQPEANIIAPAKEAAVPHTTGSDAREIRAGESLIVDLFPKGRLFADCTRTFCVGEPPEVVERAHRDVVAALQDAEANARAGVEGFDLQARVCGRFEALGWPTPISDPGSERGYVHGLGHGVGYELHELPSFREHQVADGVLAVDDVITLEPGLYDPEAGWGVRVEDLYRVTPDGVDPLVTLPRDLDPRAW